MRSQLLFFNGATLCTASAHKTFAIVMLFVFYCLYIVDDVKTFGNTFYKSVICKLFLIPDMSDWHSLKETYRVVVFNR